jgi:hypothetical protein
MEEEVKKLVREFLERIEEDFLRSPICSTEKKGDKRERDKGSFIRN